MKTLTFLLLILCMTAINSWSQSYDPIAKKEAMVISGDVRFTVLTPRVIRMEWSGDGQFEDHASLTFVNRNLPVPSFTTSVKKGWLIISTGVLTLKYRENSGQFNAKNLTVEVSAGGKAVTWHPGMKNKGNLFGTARTLDGYDGNYSTYDKKYMTLDPGILSTDGWVMIDDSDRPLFDNSAWPWVMPRPEKSLQDLYFFGYGRDYKTALYDFTQVAGKIPMPPKFAFGVWWSRYWAYTDEELKELVHEYDIHKMPLDVLVIDMDWHIVDKKEWYVDGKKINDQAGEWAGWTGYTWNTDYFPDPAKFLQWTNDKDLHTCLNLHPASGIQPFEKVYPAFAKAMGVDPATKKYIPFDIVDKTFATNYFKLILHPMQKMGIDFWWLDWQQWSTTKIKGVNPTFYLNYVFFSDMQLHDTIRPMIMHRYGGLGNHRYQIGFSGDTRITWRSLAYQPYFTLTASNVCYGYWSHDIGGHFRGPDMDYRQDPELFTRWVQWGAFSPVFRTHCTKDPAIERRLWAWPLPYYYAMRRAVKLRYALFPYIYTAANEAYETGISLLRPMYYDHPDEENAYLFKGQYMFGDDILASPVTKPMNHYNDSRDSLYATQKIWLPEGTWIEWNSGTLMNGKQIVTRTFMLSDIPLYVRAGAIIPMQPQKCRITEKPADTLILEIFPGDKGSTVVYDDAGDDQTYIKGQYTLTDVDFTREGRNMKIHIAPVRGSFENMVTARAYELLLPLTYPPEKVEVNGNAMNYAYNIQPGTWSWDGNNMTTMIRTGMYDVNDAVNLDISLSETDISLLSGKPLKISRMMDILKRINDLEWPYNGIYLLENIAGMAETGNRISLNPAITNIKQELTGLDQKITELISVMEQINDPRYIPVLDLLKTIGQ